MDILTLELFDVTVSEALREINRALEDHPALPLRILLGSDEMLHHNILRFLERHGRTPRLQAEGHRWRMDVEGLPSDGAPPPPVTSAPPQAPRALPPATRSCPRPILLTRSSLGQGSAAIGRRLLLGVLREMEAPVPWLCLALEGLELLEDPQAVGLLKAIQNQGTPIFISRESQLFPTETGPFEIMEDSHWQRLVGRGDIMIL